MYNASYLIRSRHAIFYFRYPLPRHKGQRVSISLQTRCPKEALRLAKVLEYHAFMTVNDTNVKSLDYAEVKEMLRNHFADVLEQMKRRIDQDGALSEQRIEAFKRLQSEAQYAIERKQDELHEHMFSDGDIPEELSLDKTLQPIADRHNISLDHDSKERTALRQEYKHALNGYIDALLSYNDSTNYYDYSQALDYLKRKKSSVPNNQLKLSNVIDSYLKEVKGKVQERAYRQNKDCTMYLVEALGKDFLISDIDYPEVKAVTEMLIATPTNRSKMPQTRDYKLAEQIVIADEMDMDVFADTNVNKYLGYMSSLFTWAMKNKLVLSNPFANSKIKVDKNKIRRRNFDRQEVKCVLESLQAIDKKNALGKTRYWSTLLYIYTGARLNEIASLTPDDIIEDKETGIAYIRITDEEESKKVNDLPRMMVPV